MKALEEIELETLEQLEAAQDLTWEQMLRLSKLRKAKAQPSKPAEAQPIQP